MKVVVDANFTGIQCNGTDVRTYVHLQVVHSTEVNSKSQNDTSKHRHLSLVASFETLSEYSGERSNTGVHSYTTVCVETTIEFLGKGLVPVLWSGPLVTTLHCVHYKYTTYNLLWLHLTTLFTILYVCSHNIVIWTSTIYDRITTMGSPREEV